MYNIFKILSGININSEFTHDMCKLIRIKWYAFKFPF